MLSKLTLLAIAAARLAILAWGLAVGSGWRWITSGWLLSITALLTVACLLTIGTWLPIGTLL